MHINLGIFSLLKSTILFERASSRIKSFILFHSLLNCENYTEGEITTSKLAKNKKQLWILGKWHNSSWEKHAIGKAWICLDRNNWHKGPWCILSIKKQEVLLFPLAAWGRKGWGPGTEEKTFFFFWVISLANMGLELRTLGHMLYWLSSQAPWEKIFKEKDKYG